MLWSRWWRSLLLQAARGLSLLGWAPRHGHCQCLARQQGHCGVSAGLWVIVLGTMTEGPVKGEDSSKDEETPCMHAMAVAGAQEVGQGQ